MHSNALENLKVLDIENGEITLVEILPAGTPNNSFGIPMEPIQEYCRVCISLNPVGESNIKVEIWLPTE